MPEKNETMSITDIMQAYGISRTTVIRRVREGVLTPVNASPALYRQHKLLFNREDVEQALQGNKDEPSLLQTA